MAKRNDSINVEFLREVLDYDPETGIFMWKERKGVPAWWNTKYAGKIAGNLDGGYIKIGVKGKIYKAHRLAWLYVYGEWPSNQIDHRDIDRTNNRIGNLRLATRQQNSRNSGPRVNNTSGITGVNWSSRDKKYIVRITIDYKRIYLGYFDEIKEAIAARKEAEIEYFGEFRFGASTQ